jgi:hypothetical protein
MTYRDWLRNPRCRHCGSSKLTIGCAPDCGSELTAQAVMDVACAGCGIKIANWRDFLIDADPPVLAVLRSAARQRANVPGHGPY